MLHLEPVPTPTDQYLDVGVFQVGDVRLAEGGGAMRQHRGRIFKQNNPACPVDVTIPCMGSTGSGSVREIGRANCIS